MPSRASEGTSVVPIRRAPFGTAETYIVDMSSAVARHAVGLVLLGALRSLGGPTLTDPHSKQRSVDNSQRLMAQLILVDGDVQLRRDARLDGSHDNVA